MNFKILSLFPVFHIQQFFLLENGSLEKVPRLWLLHSNTTLRVGRHGAAPKIQKITGPKDSDLPRVFTDPTIWVSEPS
jgi:hypothetical protein